MTFTCTAMFGLFCIAAPMGEAQINLHRSQGEGHIYNSVGLKVAGWQAQFVYTDHPATEAAELIVPVDPKNLKILCQDGQCIRYEAFCNVLPVAFKTNMGRMQCTAGFDVGEWAPGVLFANRLMFYADDEAGVNRAIQSLAFVKPKDANISVRPDGSYEIAQPGNPEITIPFSALALTMWDVGSRPSERGPR